MIKAIDSKYCKDNLVQLMPLTDVCQLIMDTDEIILLKIGNNILINKYTNHPSRYLFPYSDNERNSVTPYSSNYNELFEYNKLYLNYRGSIREYNFHKNYFVKGTNRALFLKESLSVDDRNNDNHKEYLTRNEVEKVFDDKQYDSMYIIDKNGNILYAKSKKDGCIIKEKIILSDNEIIELEAERRISNIKIALMSTGNRDAILDVDHKNKKIEDIKNLNLYGGMFNKYGHLLITSKDGQFNMKWFSLDFIEQNKFRLTTSPIPVIEPTIDDIINYTKNNNIENTPEPYIGETNESIRQAIEKIPDEISSQITLEEKDFYGDGPRNPESSFSKKLKKIFRNNNHKKDN